MAASDFSATCKTIRSFYNTGVTREYSFRRSCLKKLRDTIIAFEKPLTEALYADLKKNAEEAWVTEIGFVLSELNMALKNLKEWMQPERVSTNLINFPSSSYILKDPLGVVLIIGPWNYPLQLVIAPLISAVAAGNCVILKPSEFAPETASVIEKIIQNTFEPDHVKLVTGNGEEVVPSLINSFRFDHVFYTGSTNVGRLIYKMAAEHLIPVTLELGGKSPCIVESDARLKTAARRIAVTKFSNAGQMCVAPDYVLVHESVKNELIEHIKNAIRTFYSDRPSSSYNFGKIVNRRQFKRLVGYLSEGSILYGGNFNEESLHIEPTLLDNIQSDGNMMKDEIFGPVLPLIGFSSREEALEIIARNPDPLAFYVFTSDKKTERFWLQNVSFGGGCINNASWHLTNPNLPFGGKGYSGLGSYHGKAGFTVFSHHKSVMKTPTWFDPAIKYPPFEGKISLFKKLFR